ncbi:MAG TPA: hypothetical protein VJG30_04665 [Candidatus Nanoarchaeia archaeon]|nr:hypothetical protein [Candidatus Nanoarchaeia archaeon]
MQKEWIVGVSIGLVFVFSIVAFSYTSNAITGQAFSFRDFFSTCSGGPGKQGTSMLCSQIFFFA